MTPINAQVYGPPQGLVPITDDAWRQWFTDVLWPIVGKGINNSGPQGTFPQLQVGNARFTRENEAQELINVDQGVYVNYTSAVQDIIYGFACNVRRSGGSAFTVGAQINAWGEVGSTGDVYGLATTATCQPSSSVRNVIGYEPDVVNAYNNNTGVKWGVNVVFKDRGDNQVTGATTDALGSNYFNYQAVGFVLTAQPRSTTGEFCGWTVGMDFIDGWCDQASVPAYSAAVTYPAGAIVSSGGVLWKAITTNTNVVPGVGPNWVQRTYSGTTNLAVGIDFSSMGTTGMSRMASAVRLRSTQYIHWEETGAIGTQFDAVSSILNLCSNQGTPVFGVEVATGVGHWVQAAIALGGGAAATLGTIGGSGPGTATQAGWEKVVLNGVTYYRPLWR